MSDEKSQKPPLSALITHYSSLITSPGRVAGLPSRIFPFRFPTSSGSAGERQGTMTRHHLWAGAISAAVGLVLISPARAGGIARDLNKQIHANPAANQPLRVIVQFNRPGVD